MHTSHAPLFEREQEQRAGYIRMQPFEGDRDRERAFHSCATVKVDMVPGQRKEEEYCPVRVN